MVGVISCRHEQPPKFPLSGGLVSNSELAVDYELEANFQYIKKLSNFING